MRTPALDALSEAALMLAESTRGKPHEVGQELALWLRRTPISGITSSDGRVDPDAILHGFGVRLEEISLADDRLDAVSCWGPSSGPAILVNGTGKHAQGAGGRRATLAHELCHLLVDRRRGLPVAEVLGGRSPRALEQRAAAFAAELLLPREVAGRALSRAADASAAVSDLREAYGASGVVIAWQAVRSEKRLSAKSLKYLEGLIPAPELSAFRKAYG